jgi:hypothetical protein
LKLIRLSETKQNVFEFFQKNFKAKYLNTSFNSLYSIIYCKYTYYVFSVYIFKIWKLLFRLKKKFYNCTKSVQLFILNDYNRDSMASAWILNYCIKMFRKIWTEIETFHYFCKPYAYAKLSLFVKFLEYWINFINANQC